MHAYHDALESLGITDLKRVGETIARWLNERPPKMTQEFFELLQSLSIDKLIKRTSPEIDDEFLIPIQRISSRMESLIEDRVDYYSKMSVSDFQNIGKTKADREKLSKAIVGIIYSAYEDELLKLGAFSFKQLGPEDKENLRKEQDGRGSKQCKFSSDTGRITRFARGSGATERAAGATEKEFAT